jgi:serine O-acetyltransferase
VTIGTSAGGRAGAPTIGDEAYVGAGAKVIGSIRVGTGAKIAANSLVVTDVAEGATVMGVPARVV